MDKTKEQKNSAQHATNLAEAEEQQRKAEEKKNNSFSFIVGIFIAMAIIILFAIFFR